ncbi:MAG: leucine-rich repeat domain-containing protein [Clostridia bacterium]|nr:leucine-rich repeat domain-containing protein [Clostridia bacterium]
MNSFNDIKRFKYSENKQSVVSLDEYVIFTDDRKREKYIVFKFNNNLNQILYGVRFEVVQYNADGNIVEKNIIKHNKIIVGKNKTFIPEAKMKAHFDCARVSVNLLYAHFTTTIWENGIFTPISYSFEEHKKDIPTTKTKKELKAEYKKVKKNSKTASIQQQTTEKIQARVKEEVYALKDGHSSEINKKNRFQFAEVSKKNKVIIPKVLGFLLSFCFIFVSFYAIFFHSTSQKNLLNESITFSVGDFDYAHSGILLDYFGNDKDVVVKQSVSYSLARDFNYYVNYCVDGIKYVLGLTEKPIYSEPEIYEITINKIGERAFAGNGLEKLTLPRSVISLESEAFKNCVNLNQIVYETSNKLVVGYGALENTGFETFNYNFVYKLGERALANCSALTEVIVPNADLLINSLEESSKIEKLAFSKTNHITKFSQIFGGKIPSSLQIIEIIDMDVDSLPDGYFNGLEKGQQLIIVGGVSYLPDRLF